jgi:hypothetical protein
MRKTLSLILFLVVLAAGCLETKEAWPAVVTEPILKDVGWVSVGDVQKQSQTQNFGSATVKVNTAIMNYRDDALAMNISDQVRKLTDLTPKQASGATQFTSQLTTLRLVLPAGISLPSELMNKITASQIDKIASQNNIRDFHETGSKKTPLSNGKEAEVKNYDGFIDFEGSSIKIRGMITTWPDAGSNIIVFGVLPVEDIIITPESGKPVSVNVNGEEETRKMIRLINNVM